MAAPVVTNRSNEPTARPSGYVTFGITYTVRTSKFMQMASVLNMSLVSHFLNCLSLLLRYTLERSLIALGIDTRDIDSGLHRTEIYF